MVKMWEELMIRKYIQPTVEISQRKNRIGGNSENIRRQVAYNYLSDI